MNLENFKKVTNNKEFEKHKEELTKEVISYVKSIFLQTFDKDQLNLLFNKFKELNEEAKTFNLEFLNKDENPGEFLHEFLRMLIKDDKYGKIV